VVGYLPTYRDLSPESLQLELLTHLCIAFANPTGEGSRSDFPEPVRARITPLVEAAHARGVRVLASIAGGTKEQGDLVAAELVPARVDAYVAGLVDLVEHYGLDGIDVDIEGDAITETYEPFVTRLDAALGPERLLTAAVATKNGAPVSDGALRRYDFVNIMAYDHCSWSEEACDQASLAGTQQDLDYWTGERRLPRHATVLGVPFYGWCWGCDERQTALTYGQILAAYPEAKTEDWIRRDGVEISLNSAATVAEKARWAGQYGGVMIWELGQDAAGEESLLRVVADAYGHPPATP
jgi:GH18 family chitinase